MRLFAAGEATSQAKMSSESGHQTAKTGGEFRQRRVVIHDELQTLSEIRSSDTTKTSEVEQSLCGVVHSVSFLVFFLGSSVLRFVPTAARSEEVLPPVIRSAFVDLVHTPQTHEFRCVVEFQ